jgi:hypothetical protein
MSRHIPFMLTALLVNILVSACSTEHECTYEGSERIEIPTDQACPSEVEAADVFQRTTTGFQGVNVTFAGSAGEGAQTICWYREVTNPPYRCLSEKRQRTHAVVDRMRRWDPPYLEKYSAFCEGEQNVYAYPLPAEPGQAVECPISQSLAADFRFRADGTTIGDLVARDSLAARTVCNYKIVAARTCSSGIGRIPGLSPE